MLSTFAPFRHFGPSAALTAVVLLSGCNYSFRAGSFPPPHIQSIAGSQIRMKYTPRLTFKLDPSISEGLKIDQLLHELDDPAEEPHATD